MNKNVHTHTVDSIVGEKYILLADDDSDDCMFFANALEELKVPFKLKTVFEKFEFRPEILLCFKKKPNFYISFATI